MNEVMKLKLMEIVKTAKFLANPGSVEVIEEAVKAVEEYPSNYNMGTLLRLLGDILQDN